MPQSFNCNHLHIVFSTKGRANTISEPKRMWSYLGGIATNINATPLTIGGTKNRVHLLLTVPADLFVEVVEYVEIEFIKMDERTRKAVCVAARVRVVQCERSNLTAVTKIH